MDFRIGIFLKFIVNKFRILDENLTYYRQSNQIISKKFKYLSMNWWRRRKQAHNYVNYLCKKNKINYSKNLDYFLTEAINKFFIK